VLGLAFALGADQVFARPHCPSVQRLSQGLCEWRSSLTLQRAISYSPVAFWGNEKTHKENFMRKTMSLWLGALLIGLAVLLAFSPIELNSQQSASVSIDQDDVGGVVTSAKGPEAGVWVIAETKELPTRFARMVVTDDRGRYVIPDLPKANFDIWVRGYGLVDSPKIKSAPGKILNLKAVVAPNDAAAAEFYPAIHWYSMMKIPAASEFGGEGKPATKLTQKSISESDEVERLAPTVHSIGTRSTRTFPQNVPFPYGQVCQLRGGRGFVRIQSGQGGVPMFARMTKELDAVPIKYLADWTDRVAKGELPSYQTHSAARGRAQHRCDDLGLAR
jgi:hypothetical protein